MENENTVVYAVGEFLLLCVQIVKTEDIAGFGVVGDQVPGMDVLEVHGALGGTAASQVEHAFPKVDACALHTLHAGANHAAEHLVAGLYIGGDGGLGRVDGLVVIQKRRGLDDAVPEVVGVDIQFLQGAEHEEGAKMGEMQKRTWAEISLNNIEHNFRAVKAALPAGCRYLGVVKADAYGHGALQVAHRLERAGADYLAVSCLDEAVELRRGGITMPILILGHTPAEYTKELIDNNITQAVTCKAKAEEYSAAAAALGKTLKVHIKLDTGMA